MGAPSPAVEAAAESPERHAVARGPDAHDEDESPLEESPRAVTPRRIVEAMLFVGQADGRPLTARQMAAPLRDIDPEQIAPLVAELNEVYRQHRAAVEIVREGAGFRMQLRADLQHLRPQFQGRSKTARLSEAAVETLALVAYKQGISARRIDRLRGSQSRAVLDQLVRRQLLRVERGALREEGPQYFTTPRFARLLGIRSLEDLPRTAEWDDRAEPEEKT
jgi:segregation and condensation protein B